MRLRSGGLLSWSFCRSQLAAVCDVADVCDVKVQPLAFLVVHVHTEVMYACCFH